jgi:Tfp pilus assembly protein PilF
VVLINPAINFNMKPVPGENTMQRTFKTVATVSVLGTLMACAQMGKPPAAGVQSPVTGPKGQVPKIAAPVRMAGAPALPPGASSAEVAYVQGRAAHGLGQLGQATAHYEQVLRLEPRHVGALNALGVIHAQDGRTDDALAMFARAIALAPEAPHLYNNAGYALLRADRLDEAGFQLERAQQLSPGSAQTQQNLALLAQERRKAATTQAQADIPTASADTAEVASHGARLVAVAPQIYELQTVASRQAPQQAKAVQAVPVAEHQSAGEKSAAREGSLVNAAHLPPVPSRRETPAAAGAGGDTLRGVRLEVANGVGITNLARRTADRLAGTGVITARLTNVRPYRQMKTEIQYGVGQDALAKALQTRLPLAATATAAQLQGNVQLRLVLGHDLAGRIIAAWLEGRDTQTATLPAAVPADVTSAVSGGGGWMWG